MFQLSGACSLAGHVYTYVTLMEDVRSWEVSELGARVGMLLLHDFHFFIYENLEIFQKTEIMGLEEAMDIKKKVDMC